MTASYPKIKLGLGLSSTQLKIIAMTLMLIDHIGAFLLTDQDAMYPICRAIGRLAFPIFFFLIVEGVTHTGSILKYAARMAVFALISTPPYNLVHGNEWYSLEEMNVFFTLLLGIIAILFVDFAHDIFERIGCDRLAESKIACTLLALPFILSQCFIASAYNVDYGGYGIITILVFWLLRERPLAAWGIFALMTFVCYNFIWIKSRECLIMDLPMNFYYIVMFQVWKNGYDLMFVSTRQMLAPLAAIPCAFYNGQRGSILPSKSKYEKYIFYAFYPVHLMIIWAIQMCM